MSRCGLHIALILCAGLALSLAACQQPAQEPASGAPDAADVAAADAQPVDAAPVAPVAASADALPVKKTTANDATMAAMAVAPPASVGASGYGALHFGMTRSEAEAAIGERFSVSVQQGCRQVRRAAQPAVAYRFDDGKLQRIDVHDPRVMADGGGHVGMLVDDIRTLYAGHLNEQPDHAVQGGLDLKVAGTSNGNGIVFQTDAKGNVTAFRAGIAQALDAPEGCP